MEMYDIDNPEVYKIIVARHIALLECSVLIFTITVVPNVGGEVNHGNLCKRPSGDIQALRRASSPAPQ
jgi:hypothetical protein